jgi:predicted component of type VI protein secretion system
LERSIATTINNFEPRVILQDVNVELIPERNAASIQITYSIRMTNTTETFDLFLERA